MKILKTVIEIHDKKFFMYDNSYAALVFVKKNTFSGFCVHYNIPIFYISIHTNYAVLVLIKMPVFNTPYSTHLYFSVSHFIATCLTMPHFCCHKILNFSPTFNKNDFIFVLFLLS